MSQQAVVQGLQAANTATGVSGDGVTTCHRTVTLWVTPFVRGWLLVDVEFGTSSRCLTLVLFPKGFIPSLLRQAGTCSLVCDAAAMQGDQCMWIL